MPIIIFYKARKKKMINGLSRRQRRFKSAWGRQNEINALREIVGRFLVKSVPPVKRLVLTWGKLKKKAGGVRSIAALAPF